MVIRLAYSPCPNDTFAFHAMTHGLVDTEGLKFVVEHADVEELNKRTSTGLYDMCKLSYNAYFHLCHKYIMLNSGSALGYNNGPLLVSRKDSGELTSSSIVAIPGRMTTAALLLDIAYPFLKNKPEVLFSEIAQGVMSKKYDAGVLIHEGRFTYQKEGLKLIRDLGEYWHYLSGRPIPLGGIVVSRGLDKNLQKKIDQILKRSIEFALEHPDTSDEYVSLNAQIADKEIQKKHIELYVNKFSLDLGEEGKNAVYSLYLKANKEKVKLMDRDSLFV